jgi:hypothetical protein
MEERHPDDRSHWYLFIPGTEQAAQGPGMGSALLAQMLAHVDADGMPAYLESSNERNLALYGRHGFEITGEVVRAAATGWAEATRAARIAVASPNVNSGRLKGCRGLARCQGGGAGMIHRGITCPRRLVGPVISVGSPR